MSRPSFWHGEAARTRAFGIGVKAVREWARGRRLIQRIADQLLPGGRLLFTSSAAPLVWNDAMTGLESRSLGAVEYRSQLAAAGLSAIREYEDEGENHYFEVIKKDSGD